MARRLESSVLQADLIQEPLRGLREVLASPAIDLGEREGSVRLANLASRSALNWLTLLHDLSRVGAKGFRAAEPEGCIIPPARLPIGPVPTEDKFFHELVPEPAVPLAEISASGLIRLNGHFRERSICGRQAPLYIHQPFHDTRTV